jgi:hypothetical protein
MPKVLFPRYCSLPELAIHEILCLAKPKLNMITLYPTDKMSSLYGKNESPDGINPHKRRSTAINMYMNVAVFRMLEKA